MPARRPEARTRTGTQGESNQLRGLECSSFDSFLSFLELSVAGALSESFRLARTYPHRWRRLHRLRAGDGADLRRRGDEMQPKNERLRLVRLGGAAFAELAPQAQAAVGGDLDPVDAVLAETIDGDRGADLLVHYVRPAFDRPSVVRETDHIRRHFAFDSARDIPGRRAGDAIFGAIGSNTRRSAKDGALRGR